MDVFHVEHVETYGGPVETHNLGLYASWSKALTAAKAAMVPYLGEDGREHYGRPDITVDADGFVTSAAWDDGHDSWHITRREVK